MIVTLAGHVDHGKTSIVRTLTGVDTDRLAEEKRRGLTIDLGFAYADIHGQRVGFVDVPGHHRFIHNMVAGVAGRQFALLVVAADDGVMPQSREHLQILRLLGLQRGLVALNKVDRVDDDRVTEVRRQVRDLGSGTFLEDAPIIDLSCESGTGFDGLRAHLADAATRTPDREQDAPFRLAIDRAFTIRGSGVVVTGTVTSGSAAVGDRLVLASTGAAARVRGLHVQDESASRATTGDRAAINLAGVAVDEVGRGDWLLDPDVRDPQTGFAARLSVVDDFPRPVRHNAAVHVYHATSHAHGRLLLLDSARVPPGGEALVDVLCDTPLHVKVGDRVVLRDQDLERTLGGGRVVDLGVPRTRRRGEGRRTRLSGLDSGDPAGSLVHLAVVEPVDGTVFARDWNARVASVDALATDQGLEQIDGHWLAPALIATARQQVETALSAHHQAHPDSDGMTLEALAGRDPTRRLVLAQLVERGTVRVGNGLYADAAHRATLPDDVSRLFGSVEQMLDSIQPPSLGDLAKRLKRPFTPFEQDMRALPAFGLAVRISPTRYYLPGRLLELANTAINLDSAGPFTVRQFRDATGVGRNVVIEVLEHFDAKGFTRRQGDTRTVVATPSAVAA
ncbi:MAG: selenocysteine-specific translation elongation factor [Gammaproteobacteria bacterium]|nr:selenocysteine-specific translation elongation factor [Gammaproteobacteria bacterium]